MPKKCKAMHLGHRNHDHTYYLNGILIQNVEEEKDLSIEIDNQLNFHKQTTSAIAKASQILSVVRRSFAYAHLVA